LHKSCSNTAATLQQHSMLQRYCWDFAANSVLYSAAVLSNNLFLTLHMRHMQFRSKDFSWFITQYDKNQFFSFHEKIKEILKVDIKKIPILWRFRSSRLSIIKCLFIAQVSSYEKFKEILKVNVGKAYPCLGTDLLRHCRNREFNWWNFKLYI